MERQTVFLDKKNQYHEKNYTIQVKWSEVTQ